MKKLSGAMTMPSPCTFTHIHTFPHPSTPIPIPSTEYRSMTPLHKRVAEAMAEVYGLYTFKNCEIR